MSLFNARVRGGTTNIRATHSGVVRTYVYRKKPFLSSGQIGGRRRVGATQDRQTDRASLLGMRRWRDACSPRRLSLSLSLTRCHAQYPFGRTQLNLTFMQAAAVGENSRYYRRRILPPPRNANCDSSSISNRPTDCPGDRDRGQLPSVRRSESPTARAISIHLVRRFKSSAFQSAAIETS